jgi:hypothetical protein
MLAIVNQMIDRSISFRLTRRISPRTSRRVQQKMSSTRIIVKFSPPTMSRMPIVM